MSGEISLVRNERDSSIPLRSSRNDNGEIKMLLQVHDELVFEVKKDKVKKWAKIIKSEMENAAKLKVPLKVEAKVGRDWRDMGEISNF